MRTFDEYGERFDGNGSMMLVTDALADKEEAVQFNKGELIEKQKYILELEGQIVALTEDRDKWQSKAHYQNQDNLKLTAENKRLLLIVTLMCRDEDHRGYFLSDLDIGRENIDIGWIKAILDQDALKQGNEAGG